MHYKVLLLLFSMSQFLFAIDIQQRTGDFPSKEMQSQNKEIVKLVVEEISKTLPQTVDKYTKFVNIQSENSTLIYTFEINTGSKSDEYVKKEDHSRMKEAVTIGVCNSSKRFLDAQIDISYIYTSAKTSSPLFQFDITQRNCFELVN